ncbi:amino acid adenylation domain-containing protein [Spirosoma sp. KCTC 42546]|uniref:non-ribosomal peptide synthetase n=1 Tax=Spirosoma sp. KCTC 42546 TaxID=2520506 RepID=UPI0011582D1D|nr:non-ribosomal peptide synthetase [Spirosoma sp. KCTC 42546]QDK77161.1 amino acid adenylation domain-containing protein [Spirosoma sp. KCTC 42546]
MPPSCFIIGEGTLLIECSTILCQRGFLVKGIISQDPQVHSYCKKAGLPFIDSSSHFITVLNQEPFDYLFSISNGYILSEELLALPRLYAFNYHDGPLPAYAGVHASFWALANGEKTHGVTWHLIDKGVDTGAIVKQKHFPIQETETSISLNITCYSVAVDCFRDILDELEVGTLTTQPQDPTHRSYYARNKRPDLVLNFAQSAITISRLHRALDFGFQSNPFGFLKLWAGGRFWLVREVTATQTKAQCLSGSIEALLPDKLLVATNDYLLVIGAIQNLTGEPVSMATFYEQTSLTEGQLLTLPAPEVIQAIGKNDKQCAVYQSYWVNKLSNFQPTTLPWSVPANKVNENQPERSQINIPLYKVFEGKNGLKSTEKSHQAMTALLILLARLTNQQSVSVGYRSERSAQISAETVGLFAEYIPVEVAFDWDAGFEKALNDTQQELIAVNNHLTFTQDNLATQTALKPLTVENDPVLFPIVIGCKTAELDYSLPPKKALQIILSTEGNQDSQVLFDPAIWSVHWVSDLVNRWLMLLEDLVFHPDQPLRSVSLLTPDERQRMLIDWNATKVPYPANQTIHQLVEAQVQLRPQAEALRFGALALTYEQLNHRANQLAWHLRNQGVKSETLIGICLERSPDMIVSLLAILKVGGAYVPLDPTFPAARLAGLVAQTGIHTIITRKIWLDRLPATTTTVLIDENQALITQQSVHNLSLPIRSDQLAYVLFTSGSTGRSKGVAIPHRAILRTVQGANYMRLDESICMLGLAPLAFDASTLEIWGSLANGGRLVLVMENPPSLDDIKQTIQANSVNAAFFTAALFNVLVDSGIDSLVTLTQLATGGEAASAKHVIRARHQLPNCTLINGYGPTESTTFASFYNLSTGHWETSSVPIGKPLSNTQLYIVDSFLNPMPVGVPGELLIGGDGLAREYLHQPELTQLKFIPDPFSDRPGSRLYRTGDQARYQSDGTIDFLGRLDDQLKIRGFRIEPVEIEQALCQHPTIGEALVVADELSSGMKRLVAYIVPKSGEIIQVESLRVFLKTSLPDYLIPNVFVPLTAIPLTVNGKVDKANLPTASPNATHRQSDVQTSTEQAMILLWTSVLNVAELNETDHFFDLGGSSLMVIQLIALISQQFGVRLSMNDVFKHPTLQQLSTYLDQLPRQSISPIVNTPDGTDSTAQFPLSFAQNRLWILEQIHPLQETYNVPIVLRIRGSLNLPFLQQSLNQLIDRHQILRTTFGHFNGEAFQKIEPAFLIDIPVSFLVEPTNLAQNETIATWLREVGYQSFDLEKGPLIRVNVAKLGDQSWMVLLNFHHLIFDGLSTQVLAKELSLLYTAKLQDQPVSLPPLPIQYADYARWQTEHFLPETLTHQRAYWRNQLAGVAPLLKLPIDKPRPAIESFKGADYCFVVPKSHWQPLRHDFQEAGTTLFLRILTVYAVWLRQITGTQDIVIGIPVAGRTQPELDGLIGFFVNTLVLRIDISADLSFRQLLRNVRQLALDAYTHQTLPFEQIVEEVSPVRSRAYSPLVQVLFDLQEDTSNFWRLNELEIEQVPFQQHRAKFDLSLSCQETADGLMGTFTYRTDLFTEQAVSTLADQFIQTLEQLLSQPDQGFGQLFGSQPVPPLTPPAPIEITHPVEQVRHTPSLNQSVVRLLKTIWCELLDLPTVGLDDDFFTLGGHSLLALQLTAAIQRQTTHSLPISSIFAHPTLRQLTLYLQTSQSDVAWQSLVGVKTPGDGNALYLIHPISGDVNYVYQLAPYLPEKQALYGLRAVGLDGVTQPLESIEAMAAYYIQLILQKQPNGPYAIGGFSLGGIIAFEMARQLQEMGKEIHLLALIDAYPINPDAANHTKFPIHQLVRYYYHYWRSLPKQPAVLLPILRQKVPWISHYLLRRIWQSVPSLSGSAGTSPTESLSVEAADLLTRSFREAYSQYKFKSYEGKLVFLRVTQLDAFGTSQGKVDFGWGRYARQGVEVHQLLGEHNSLFSKPATIAQIGRILQLYLTP